MEDPDYLHSVYHLGQLRTSNWSKRLSTATRTWTEQKASLQLPHTLVWRFPRKFPMKESDIWLPERYPSLLTKVLAVDNSQVVLEPGFQSFAWRWDWSVSLFSTNWVQRDSFPGGWLAQKSVFLSLYILLFCILLEIVGLRPSQPFRALPSSFGTFLQQEDDQLSFHLSDHYSSDALSCCW